MVRTQIQLTVEQVQALKEVAAERKVSMSELIRQGVDHVLEEREEANKWRKALAMIGRYSDPEPDVSSDHDKYLEEAYR
ncbi:MAG: ribbon-helix-helix domain-containing protein [Dehalococcoidia bacterium]|nr:ribbon-helix-helix domain-containing protein [Dehalococcoidia bacterium]